MDLFTEGQKLTLFFQKNHNMVEMTCSVEKVGDDRLELVLPQYFMRYVEFLQVGKKLTAKAFSKFGTVDFNTIVISSPLEDHFVIELDYNAVKLNSGEELSVIKAIETLKINKNSESYELKTFEISADYVKFTSNNKFNVDDIIECSLNLPKDYGIISFKATIFEIDPIYDNEYTAVFMTMSEHDRQALLYYMYMYSNDIN